MFVVLPGSVVVFLFDFIYFFVFRFFDFSFFVFSFCCALLVCSIRKCQDLWTADGLDGIASFLLCGSCHVESV